MKIQALIVFLVCSISAFAAGNPKPFRTINLSTVKPDPSGCDAKWAAYLTHMLWVDDGHLVVLLTTESCTHDPKDPKIQTKLAVFDANGHLQSSVRRDHTFSVLRGPEKTLFVLGWYEVDLRNLQLHTQQTLKCPIEKTGCVIFISPSSSEGTDFALCSPIINDSRVVHEESCHFYRGRPAIKVREENNQIGIDPYTGAPPTANEWRVDKSETWSFDKQGVLIAAGTKGSASPVTSEHWKGSDDNCTGELSISVPKRFLAICNGTHFYTDGMLDSLFSYSRIALFDVASRRILARINGASYTSATLSPSGRSIAVLHDNKIRLYRVD